MLFCCHSNRSEAKNGARAWGWRSGVAGDKPESQEVELLELGETLGGWGEGPKGGRVKPKAQVQVWGKRISFPVYICGVVPGRDWGDVGSLWTVYHLRQLPKAWI